MRVQGCRGARVHGCGCWGAGAGVRGAGVPVLGCLVLAPVMATAHTFAEDRFGAQANGSISGTITTRRRARRRCASRSIRRSAATSCPMKRSSSTRRAGLANAVVILTGVKRAAAAEAVVTNEKCRFGPRVQLAAAERERPHNQQGSDPAHDAGAARKRTLDLQRRAADARHQHHQADRRRRHRAAELQYASVDARLGDRDRRCGGGFGSDGRFAIDNVPPGTYELRVWHEALKGAPQKITVVAGKPTEINFQLNVGADFSHDPSGRTASVSPRTDHRIARSVEAVRQYQVPSTSAGDASVCSPSSFTCSSLNARPASTTKV